MIKTHRYPRGSGDPERLYEPVCKLDIIAASLNHRVPRRAGPMAKRVDFSCQTSESFRLGMTGQMVET